MRILLAGGLGYIGSHTTVALLEAGHSPLIVDDLSNSRPEVLDRVAELTGLSVASLFTDVRDEGAVEEFIGSNGPVDCVIHLAGLKSVAESVVHPAQYYEKNLGSTLSVLRIMAQHHIHKLVFSSSATVYGDSPTLPHVEGSDTGRGISNPYGRTKYFIEEMLRDACAADPELDVISLRYFNPVGAHTSGKIGESPLGVPNNLMPIVAKVAAGSLEYVTVFGTDYETPDGTGLRDYIHVQDLADAHVRAAESTQRGFDAINVGTGSGVSVLQLIAEYERASGRSIETRFSNRRPGDVPVSYANVDKAARVLNWRSRLTLADACRDSWRWQRHSC